MTCQNRQINNLLERYKTILVRVAEQNTVAAISESHHVLVVPPLQIRHAVLLVRVEIALESREDLALPTEVTRLAVERHAGAKTNEFEFLKVRGRLSPDLEVLYGVRTAVQCLISRGELQETRHWVRKRQSQHWRLGREVSHGLDVSASLLLTSR